MFRRLFLAVAFAGTLASGAALAASGHDEPAGIPPASDGIRLAQSGDIEIYYDEFGRRIYVDAYTGQIVGVERPRRGEERRVMRRENRRERQERYYLDDPDDMARLERDRRGWADRRAAPPVEEYDPYYDPYGRQGWDVPPGEPLDAFPEAPRSAPLPEAPRTVTRQPVERAPLPGAKPAPRTERAVASNEPADVPAATGSTEQPAGPTIVEGAIEPPSPTGAREDVAALQILLDRLGASPGVIDGRFGSNVDKAIVAYRTITGQNLRSTDTEGIRKALAETGGDPFTTYTITATDAAGPYVASVPADYGEKAKLERLSYTSVAEALAERFHMDEAYLKALNPGANFNRAGTAIKVANIGQPATRSVVRIVADKGKKQVRAYDEAGKLVVAYPATIGSADTPSPTGTHAVSRVAINPEYTYNPKLNFKQGENDKVLTIPPGPNGPVGSIWIALDKPTYGIHGTPDPSKIGKTESHGCVRLTNWDAAELAKLVKPGVPVEFME